MSGRVSWQRLALIRGQLTERDWTVMATLTCVKLANGNQLRRATSGDNSPAGQRAARRQLARLAHVPLSARPFRAENGAVNVR
jgi:hypothetical protein